MISPTQLRSLEMGLRLHGVCDCPERPPHANVCLKHFREEQARKSVDRYAIDEHDENTSLHSNQD